MSKTKPRAGSCVVCKQGGSPVIVPSTALTLITKIGSYEQVVIDGWFYFLDNEDNEINGPVDPLLIASAVCMCGGTLYESNGHSKWKHVDK